MVKNKELAEKLFSYFKEDFTKKYEINKSIEKKYNSKASVLYFEQKRNKWKKIE